MNLEFKQDAREWREVVQRFGGQMDAFCLGYAMLKCGGGIGQEVLQKLSGMEAQALKRLAMQWKVKFVC